MTPTDAERGALPSGEQSPLLGPQAASNDDLDDSPLPPEGKGTAVIWAVLTGVFVVGLILVFTLPVPDWDDPFPSPESILDSAPVIDGHIGQPNLPHTYGPRYPGLRPVYLRDQIYLNSLGSTMRTTYLPLILTSKCRGMLISQG